MDFRSYVKKKRNDDFANRNDNVDNENSQRKNDNRIPQADVQDVLRQYQGKSQAELHQALEEEIARQRANGGIDKSQMESFYSTVAPMLSDSQRAMLDSIMGRLN